MKKFLSVILALLMVATMLPMAILPASAAAAADITVTIDTGASITLKDADSDGYYDIGTANDLYAFAAAVNGGNSAIYGELTANIVVNEGTMTESSTGVRAWTPIGNNSNLYTGTFDGGGHTISGLYFNDPSNSPQNKYVGLFGYVNGGEIKNVGVINSCINAYEYVGGVVGRANTNSKVTDCYNTGTVRGNGKYVGGVVGYNNNVTMTNCYNTGTVSGGSNYVGGVVGDNYSYVTMTNCYNTGTVRGNGKHVGGVAGYISDNCTVTSCYNTGTVSGNNNVGGVVGYNEDVTMTKCYNTGTVSGYGERVGGVVGDNYYTALTDCYNTGTVSGGSNYVGGVVGHNRMKKVTNCYNIGAVKGTQYVGGVVGHIESGSMINTYYLTGCAKDGRNTVQNGVGNGYAGGTTADKNGSTTAYADFSTGEVAYKLGGSFGQNIDNGKTVQTSPSFTGAEVYFVNGCDNSTMVYSNTDGIAHVYNPNGFCVCGSAYQPATDSNGDGVYEITNVGQLFWFAQQVNSGSTAINGELTADIVVNENVLTADGSLNGDGSNFRAWTPIGTEDNAYTGEFRGGGHTVSGLYFNDRTVYHVGLFGYVGSGGTVQNVGVIDSYFYGYSYVGGVAGCNRGTLQYVYNTGNVNGRRYAGGVTGENNYIVQYAYNTGTVFAMDYAGGVTGYNKYIVQYAYNTGSAGGAAYYGGIAGDNRHTLKDCYYLADSETDSFDGTTAKTAGQFEIGEVAYLLGSPFGQNIGTHVSPVLNLGYEVYQVQNCKNEVVYSNTNENLGHQYENGVCTICGTACPGHSYENGVCTICGAACPGHSYENGFCTVCGAACPGHSYENGFCPYGCYEPAVLNNDGVYEIYNAGQLYWFAAQVDAGKKAISGKLMADIVVNEGTVTASSTGLRAWNPIGYYNSESDYITIKGTFDGNNKTVSGLYFNSRTAKGVGLFSCVDSGSIVKNVGVINSYINGRLYVGGVAGYVLSNGTVENCYNTGTVNGNFSDNGGVIGRNYGTVENCYNTGTVGGSTEVGGVVGSNYGTVKNCYNTGTVNGSGSYIGGVVGYNYKKSIIQNCYNTGTVSGGRRIGGVIGECEGTVENSYNTGIVSGYNFVGGVLGFNHSDFVQNCYNTGNISGSDDYVGGVAGWNLDGTVQNCYNTGTVSGVSSVGGVIAGTDKGRNINCYNIGTVSGESYVGGVMGNRYSNAGTATNCYYLIGCAKDGNNTVQYGIGNETIGSTTADSEGSTIGKTAEQFASGEVAYLLNGSTSEGDLVWGQLIGTDSYPVFGGETVYYNETNGYYNILHTCDFSGEWKYDAEKHWKECTADSCDKISEEADHSFTDGKCDCGYTCPHSSYTDGVCDTCDYECPHYYGEGVLTRPERITTTEWDDGFYTYTCSACDHYYQETVKRADYAAYDAVSDDYYAIIMNSSVLGSVKDALKDAVDSLYQNHADVMAGDRIESEQEAVDKVVAEFEKLVSDAEEKIASDEYLKADYTAIDEAIADIEQKFVDENVTDEAKAGLDEIKTQLAAMKADENTSKADLAELEKALGDYEAELDKGIEDGTLVKFSGDRVFLAFVEEAEKKIDEQFGENAFYDFANANRDSFYNLYDKYFFRAAALEGGTMAENAENIEYIKGMVDELFGMVANCLDGTHNYGEGELTRPTFETAGYYTYTCTLCGHSYTVPTEKADDTALYDASMKVMEYIDNNTLTQEAKDEIYKSYRDILKNNGNVFDELGFVRGDLIEEDQPVIDAVTEALQKIIADADEKIASGEYVKADYTEIDEAIDDIEEKLASENVTDEGKAGLEEIKKQIAEMKADGNTSEADLAELEKALEDYEAELDKGIEDGTLVKIDIYKIGTELSDRWTERLEAEGLLDDREDFVNNQKFTDEAVAVSEEMEEFLASLEGTVAENAENIEKFNEMFNSFTASFENCLRGTHNFKDYEVTSPAKCGENAVETSICWFCGETDEREIEGTALTHSFTKYEETEAPKCGVAGKEISYCDNGCGATDEKEIAALEHSFLDYVSNGDATCTADGTKTAECANGCGKKDTVEDEGSMLEHVDKDGDDLCDECGDDMHVSVADCECTCHRKDVLNQFFYKIIQLIRKLFGINSSCSCGTVHTSGLTPIWKIIVLK